MCLLIDAKLHPKNKPLIAKDDIYVIKRFSKFYYISNNDLFLESPFRFYIYKYKTLEKSSIKVVSNIPHFKFDKYKAKIEKGLHSYTQFIIDTYCTDIISICKIPKNSKYFIGLYGDIVSNCLEIVDIIYIPTSGPNDLSNYLGESNWNFNKIYSKKLNEDLKNLSSYINKNYKNKLKSLVYGYHLTIKTIF